MSDNYQTTSKPLIDRVLTEEERVLFSFLKDGPRKYSAIWRYLKENGTSQSTLNRLLNKNVEENRIFRIEKGNSVFYKLNDFPFNVNALLVLLDCAIKEKEIALLEKLAPKEGESPDETTGRLLYHFIYETPKNQTELVFCQTLKRNIIRWYPKLDLRKICQLAIAEVYVSASGNLSLQNFLEGLKAAID
jgi:hypothetical protein